MVSEQLILRESEAAEQVETLHVGFIIEQALGHITHGQNLQRNLLNDDVIVPYWGLPRQDVTGGLAGRINNWTVKAGLQTRRALRQMRQETRLDALFFHTQVTAILAQDWIRRIPSIISLDATPLQYDSLGDFYDHKPGRGEEIKYRLNRSAYRAARHLVTWSDWAKQSLILDYGISAEKITVIPPGVNVSEWKPSAERTPSDTIKILFVGGNLERKGGRLLLEACRQLVHESYQIELHLVTRDTVAEEPFLTVYNNMQPNSDALKRLYHTSDIFCLPTRGDCLPMVLSEASAAGLPVVSTDVAAIPEIVHDGATGFVVPPDDGTALVAALRRLIVNPALRQQMGERGQRLVTEQFDAARNAERLLGLIKQVVNEG